MAKYVGDCLVRAATFKDFASAVSCYTTFLKTRPVTANASGVSHEDCVKAAEIYVDAFIRQGNVWLVYRDDRVIGCLGGWDLKTFNPVEHNSFLQNHRHFADVHTYTETLMQRFLYLHGFTRESLPRGHMYQFVGGVLLPEARGLKLLHPLLTHMITEIAYQGYDHAVHTSINKQMTIRTYPKYPTRVLCCLKYSDFFPGNSGFEKCTAEGHDGAYLMWDELELYRTKDKC